MFLIDRHDPNFLTNHLLYFYKVLYLLFELVIQQNEFVLIQALVSRLPYIKLVIPFFYLDQSTPDTLYTVMPQQFWMGNQVHYLSAYHLALDKYEASN